MTYEELREQILNNGYENIVLFSYPSYSNAFIGISHDNRAIYDFELMVKQLCTEDNISESEAIDFIEYNTIRALPYYEDSPIIIYKLY